LKFLEPTAVDAHLVLIGIAMQQGDYETARDCAIRAVGSNPNNLALLSARGRAEAAIGNAQMATELARMVLEQDPNSVEALGVLVDAGLTSEDRSLLQEASELAQVMLAKDPNNTGPRDIIMTKALHSRHKTLLEQARMLIESALSSNPTDEMLLLSRAHVLTSLELPQMAIPELKAYCQTEEGNSSVTALVTLADLYRLTGDADQSKQRIERAEQLDPSNQAVIHARFLWLASQKRFEQLEQISSAYLSAKQQNPTILLTAASILAASDSVKLKQEGLKLFEHAAALSPTSVDARVGVASTLYQTGDAERAKQIYRQLLDQYPNNVRILNDLAWILQEHDHSYAAALELANKGLSLAPKDAVLQHLLDTRGTILSNMKDRLADAKNDFERLVKLSPPDTPRKAKALLQLGRICAKLNDLVQAKQHLDEALEIDRKIDVFTTEERSEITSIVQM
jgi:tetratricopeptide (TPR) repeat protein